jgi:Heparinase II/III-like protein/Heparinase II/III N-terminus
MNSLLLKARTAMRLGLPNIARAMSYFMSVKLWLSAVRRLKAPTPQGPFFCVGSGLHEVGSPTVAGWQSSALLFGYWPLAISGTPPDWLANPLNGQRVASPARDWWQIPDFDPSVGDIKLIWELSRLDWLLAFAQRARNGDRKTLDKLNIWLADWCVNNPPYKGPNWKCGQEASIRVMHLAMAYLILGPACSHTSSLCELVRLHLQRIAPTLQYAMAQDNNHGTSEAAALFIGGSWLAVMGGGGERWALMGRRWLENRAARLIGPNGSFSQYSLNYHRVMLDTFCMAEVWRRYLELPAFSEHWQSRAQAATEWLRHMVNPVNGDGPNVGANDGARLLQLTDTPYRDHRPSVALAMALFAGQRAYVQSGPWEHALQWLGVSMPNAVAQPPQSHVANDGGFAVLRCGDAMAMLRYPRFRFRPSQADALHLDLWLGSENLLRDAGTYSYNTDLKWTQYFGGTASHNTVQFDDRDQMPRLSRFLFGDWLKADIVQPLPGCAQTTNFAAGYRDGRGGQHQRQVTLRLGRLRVVDKVQGFANKAVLRWRLQPGDWRLVSSPQGLCLTLDSDSAVSLSVLSSVPVLRCELVQGWESRYYFEKTPVPVLEVEIHQAGTLTTEMNWQS